MKHNAHLTATNVIALQESWRLYLLIINPSVSEEYREICKRERQEWDKLSHAIYLEVRR